MGDVVHQQVEHIVISDAPLPVTKEQDLRSTQVAVLTKGTRVNVLQQETINGEVRARIAFPKGWVSLQYNDVKLVDVVHQQASASELIGCDAVSRPSSDMSA